jgi:hypothetical protein
MSKNVKITVKNAGVHFATYAVVKQGRKVLHETRDYPYGFRSNAYEAALSWVQDHGFTVG